MLTSFFFIFNIGQDEILYLYNNLTFFQKPVLHLSFETGDN